MTSRAARNAIPSWKTPTSFFLVDEDDIQFRMTGALGNDTLAPVLRKAMEDNGVDVLRVRTVKDKLTGVGVVLVETMVQENRILFNPGANHDLQPAEFETLDSLNGDGGGRTSSKPDLLISQMELRKETVVQVLRTASEHGVTTLLNPAPAHALELEIYKMVSHLVVNETEAAMLADIDVATMTDETEYGRVTDIFLRKGVPNVVVTLGPKGAYYSTKLEEGGLVAAEKVTNVIDTTGAGDTFVGAYGVEVVRPMASGLPFNMKKGST